MTREKGRGDQPATDVMSAARPIAESHDSRGENVGQGNQSVADRLRSADDNGGSHEIVRRRHNVLYEIHGRSACCVVLDGQQNTHLLVFVCPCFSPSDY